jgi:hypothetical protein
MRDLIYWNLHDKVFTVQDPLTGRVGRHTPSLTLRDVEFKVDQEERARMLREKRRNVHARVHGEILPDELEITEDWIRVIYDVDKYDSFVSAHDERPVVGAELLRMVVKFGTAHVYAKGLVYRD